MRDICGIVAFFAALVASSASAVAQTAGDSVPLLPSRSIPVATQHPVTAPDLSAGDAEARADELREWMQQFESWQTWSAEWSNRRERGWFTGFRDRREKPEPPVWLADECEAAIVETEPLTHGCTLLAQWGEDRLAAEVRQARAAAAAQQEEDTKTVWWEHVHLDLLWPAAQLRSSIYGVVGTHATTTVKGRLQVFIAPGVMFLNLPARNGSRVWKVATNYGIGYRLFDFSLAGRRATLHVNLAKAWLLSDNADLLTRRSMDFAGFSMTFNKPK
jgi:hypothetical protein